MWSPLILLGPVILLWRTCAFKTVFGEIPVSVARLSGEFLAKGPLGLLGQLTSSLKLTTVAAIFPASCWV